MQRMNLWEAIERVGNRLPHPITLFFAGCLFVLCGSEIASRYGWAVVNPGTGATETARSLATLDGCWWIWQHLIENFTHFPPLGVVLVGMLGIGLMERSGLMHAILQRLVAVTPPRLLTPAVVFAGVMSSFGSDAGYIVLPPAACAIYARLGRSPLVGLAAVFAGIGAGFSANLLITGIDPLLQSFTQAGAQILWPDYVVDVRCNYYFMFVSTWLVTLVAWATTVKLIEPRFSAAQVAAHIACYAQFHAVARVTQSQPTTGSVGEELAARVEDGDRSAKANAARESRALRGAALAAVVLGALLAISIVSAHGSLHGQVESRPGVTMDRWVVVIVPLLFVMTSVPGLVYGVMVGTIRSDRDVADMLNQSLSSLGSYLVLAFFAGQFVAWFTESNLGRLLALQGVVTLQRWDLPPALYLVAIVSLTALLNLFIGSASAKWALLSAVFVPLFAGVGIRPELTQAAYRVGDSVTNVIAPLNPYVVVMLVYFQQCDSRAGLGSMISIMLPYAVTIGIAWTALLLLWASLGWPLGPGARMPLPASAVGANVRQLSPMTLERSTVPSTVVGGAG